jgi:hypothetical protein
LLQLKDGGSFGGKDNMITKKVKLAVSVTLVPILPEQGQVEIARQKHRGPSGVSESIRILSYLIARSVQMR